MNVDELLANANISNKIKTQFTKASEIENTFYPLASVGLTDALGGGIGAGRMTTIYGNTSSGKSTLLLSSVAKWQKMGLTCCYVDSEMTFSKEYAESLGVDTDNLILLQTKSFGKVNDQVTPLVKAGLDILIIDSISDLLPEQFLDDKGEIKEFEKQKQIGAHARSTSILINSLHYVNDKTALIMLSQTTTDLSGMYPVQIPMGGKKLLFGSSQVVKLTSSNSDKNMIVGEVYSNGKVFQENIGRKVEFKVEKNKMAAQGRTGTYDLYYDGDVLGIDFIGEAVDLAIKYDIVQAAGAWNKYDGQSFQGRKGVIAYFKDNPEAFEQLTQEIYALKNGGELVGA